MSTPGTSVHHHHERIRMGLNRRDVLKLGLFSSAALMLPAERLARAKLAVADRMPTSRLPKPFTVPFATPPVLEPALRGSASDYYDIVQKQAGVEILPGYTTQIWGYNGITPGPTIKVRRGRKSVVRQANNLPDVHPTQRYNVWTVDAPPRVRVAARVRRLRERHHVPRRGKDYRYPNAQDGRTLWYHDHGVHITAENAYMGLAGMYIMQDDFEQASGIPQGPLRRAADPARRALHQQGPAHLRRQQRVVGHGRRHPRQRPALAGHARRAAQVPLPGAERVDLTLLRLQPEHRRPVLGDRDGRRAHAAGAARHPHPARHGRALRDRHRLLEVQGRPARRAAQRQQAAEQHHLRQHRQDHGVRHRRPRRRAPHTTGRRRS